MKPDKKLVGERIKIIKESLGLSLTELGDILGGVPKGTVNSWIRGLSIPPKKTVQHLAFLAKTSSEWILFGKESEELCLSCFTVLQNGECVTCLKNRQQEMIMFFDQVDSKLFPMTLERKSLILSIIDFELKEIDEKLSLISLPKLM